MQRQRNGHSQLLWRCTRCRDQISLCKGTIFHYSHLTLGQTLMVMMCFAQGLGIGDAIRSLRWSSDSPTVSAVTIVRYYTILREYVKSYMANAGPIGGPGQIVQIDEALIGRRKYHRGRVVQGTWVLGMISSDGHVRFEVVKDRKRDTLEGVIVRNVICGSTIHTDEWRSYNRLRQLGYAHATVNHSQRFVSPGGVHTQAIESQWRHIRRRFSKGGVPHACIESYLAEYVWRRACRRSRTDLFASLISIIKL